MWETSRSQCCGKREQKVNGRSESYRSIVAGWVRSNGAGQGRVRVTSDSTDSAALGFPDHPARLNMASVDPLKTVISIGNVDDTSLALPSVNQFRSGQQRVLEQVQTIKRTKSRQLSSRSGSTSLSPTSKSRSLGFPPYKLS